MSPLDPKAELLANGKVLFPLESAPRLLSGIRLFALPIGPHVSAMPAALDAARRKRSGNKMPQIQGGFAILIAGARAAGFTADPCSITLPTTRAARIQMTIVGSAS